MEELNPTMSGGTEGVVTPQQENPAGEGEHAGEPGAGDAGRQARQNHEFNAAMAAARRKAEKDTEERMGRQFDDDIRDQRIPNPMKPGSYFGSMAELKEYSAALRKADAEDRAQKTGRTAEDIMQEDEDRAYLAKLRKEDAAKQKAAEKKAKEEEFIRNDIENFRKKFPDVDITALDGNKAFRRFAGSRYGVEPLAALYEDFKELVGETRAAEAARRDDRAERSTGSGSGGGAGTLTAAQREELKRWNEQYPEMKMTEKDFLTR